VIWRISVRAAPITKAVYRWAGWERGLTTETIRLDPRATDDLKQSGAANPEPAK
jgi:hypothetical protein